MKILQSKIWQHVQNLKQMEAGPEQPAYHQSLLDFHQTHVENLSLRGISSSDTYHHLWYILLRTHSEVHHTLKYYAGRSLTTRSLDRTYPHIVKHSFGKRSILKHFKKQTRRDLKWSQLEPVIQDFVASGLVIDADNRYWINVKTVCIYFMLHRQVMETEDAYSYLSKE